MSVSGSHLDEHKDCFNLLLCPVHSQAGDGFSHNDSHLFHKVFWADVLHQVDHYGGGVVLHTLRGGERVAVGGLADRPSPHRCQNEPRQAC